MSGKEDLVQPEQDTQGPGDDLPTYDHLAAQSGPNSRLDPLSITFESCGKLTLLLTAHSRFGRWRGWIEKR